MYLKTVFNVVLAGIPLDKQMEINFQPSEWVKLHLSGVLETRWGGCNQMIFKVPSYSIPCMILLFFSLLCMSLEGTTAFWVWVFLLLLSVCFTFSSFRKLYSPCSERKRWMCLGSRSCHVESACITSNNSGSEKGIEVIFLWNEAVSQQISEQNPVLNIANEITVVAFSKKEWIEEHFLTLIKCQLWFLALWFFLIPFQMAQTCTGSVIQSQSISWHFTSRRCEKPNPNLLACTPVALLPPCSVALRVFHTCLSTLTALFWYSKTWNRQCFF